MFFCSSDKTKQTSSFIGDSFVIFFGDFQLGLLAVSIFNNF